MFEFIAGLLVGAIITVLLVDVLVILPNETRIRQISYDLRLILNRIARITDPSEVRKILEPERWAELKRESDQDN